jgi:hypothetical protein
MTRREFLKYSGLMILTVFGISELFRQINNLDIYGSAKPKKGFGSGPYGV